MQRLRVQYAPEDDGAGGSVLGNSGNAGNSDDTNSAGNQGNSGNAGNQSPGWLSILPEGMRDNDYLKGFNSTKEFAEGAIALNGKLSGAVFKPKEGATEQELAAYRTEMGIPDKADGYEVNTKFADDTEMPDDLKKALQEAYFEAGLSKDGADKLQGKMLDMMGSGKAMFAHYDKTLANKFTQDADKRYAETTAGLLNEWGDNYKGNMAIANRTLSLVATESQISEMKISGVLSDINVARVFLKFGNLISEDSLLGGQSPKGQLTKRMFPNSDKMYT